MFIWNSSTEEFHLEIWNLWEPMRKSKSGLSPLETLPANAVWLTDCCYFIFSLAVPYFWECVLQKIREIFTRDNTVMSFDLLFEYLIAMWKNVDLKSKFACFRNKLKMLLQYLSIQMCHQQNIHIWIS